MRSLPKHGTTCGGVGWQILALQNTENLIAHVMRKKCRDCGQLMSAHTVNAGGATCPPVLFCNADGNPVSQAHVEMLPVPEQTVANLSHDHER